MSFCNHGRYTNGGILHRPDTNFCGDCGALLSIKGAWKFLRPRLGVWGAIGNILHGMYEWAIPTEQS